MAHSYKERVDEFRYEASALCLSWTKSVVVVCDVNEQHIPPSSNKDAVFRRVQDVEGLDAALISCILAYDVAIGRLPCQDVGFQGFIRPRDPHPCLSFALQARTSELPNKSKDNCNVFFIISHRVVSN